MNNFEFYNPVKIIFGRDRLRCIDENIPKDATVLITYGMGSAKRSGLLERVKEQLVGRNVYEFGGIEPNPQYETVLKAMELVREKHVDYLLAIGGGSRCV